MTSSRREVLKLLGAAFGSVLVVACGQPTAAPTATAKPAQPTAVPKSGESLIPTAAPTKEVVGTPKPASAPTLKVDLSVPREETFVLATGPTTAIAVTDSFNYYSTRGIQSDWNLNAVINEFVLYHNIEGTAPEEQWVNGLGEKFEYNKDFTSWTIKLREGIKWNDGTPFTSADLKFTMDTVMGNPKLSLREFVMGVKSVEAPDPRTVVISFASPNPRYHFLFAARVSGLVLMAKHKWEGQDPTTYKNNPPVGTGPYKLKEVLPEQKQIVFERDDNYWGKAVFGLPKPKYVVIVSPPAADLIAEGYKTGQFDYGRSLTYDAAKVMAGESGGAAFVLPFLDMCPRALIFNHGKAPTDKLEVRLGLSNMIDRKTAAAVLWKPPSQVTSRPWYGGSTMLNWVDKSITDKYDAMYTGDQKKALEMFQKAGYKEVGGKLVDGKGEQMRIDIYTSLDPTRAEHQLGIKLAEDLKKMGVDASFKYETGAPITERRQKGDWTVQTMWQCGGNNGDPALLFQQHMTDKITAPIGELNTGTNGYWYKNSKFDELTTKLLALRPESAEAKDLYNQLYQIWMDDMISFPIMETIQVMCGCNLYWKGFPQQPNLHTHPANWHCTMMNVIKKLEAGPRAKVT